MTKILHTWPGSKTTPFCSYLGKGEPLANTALLLDHLYASSALHSDLLVGLLSANII